MGLTSSETAKWAGDEEFEDFEVMPENWLTSQVFLAMSRQWRWSGGMESRPAGLDFNALPPVYEGLAVSRKKRPEVFRGLRIMEDAALAAMLET